ncbi:MAG: diguanylate cyclase [Desulfobacterium sp.]|nr:diguanylate cyclase [Desulfobacterium sp.]MBU3949474.1 diguanylate cyclase [Pseudomonadota bacterium]MBU4010056.1 diguanylate cyclase [Pseudomonadota bacterium]MBU4037541.1 diguanylate cyclase [Pseudomonadota bacterium]
MDFMDNINPGTKNINRYFIILIVIWTLGVFATLGWDIYQLKHSTFRLANISAEISYNKDAIYRHWAAMHGGVYVPVTDTDPPNPYLNVPHRDITTTEGQKFTLINPAHMTRQVNEISEDAVGFKGHITSLNCIRPENYPDTWETESLKSFERGVKEAASFEIKSGKEYFRFMRPFITDKSCLKCHAAQGYKEGDIRGGISISIPMEPLRSVERSQINDVLIAYGFLWLLGIGGIAVSTRRLWKQLVYREKIEKEVLTLSITDQLTGLYNRRGFLSLADRQLKLADRNKNGIMLFFADLDGLKDINDRFGHKEGDKALIEAATVFKETFRTSDIIARLGGDEFAALAIDIQEKNSEIFTSRLQYLTEMQNKQENRTYKLSISIGGSFQDPENPRSIDELISQADKLMYEQKKQKKSYSNSSNE